MLRRHTVCSFLALLAAIGCEDDAPRSERACDRTEATGSATLTDFAAAGPFAVGEMQMTLVDESRVTMANGQSPELPSRTLPTLVWYPADGAGDGVPAADGDFPVMIWSHGFSSAAGEVNWLAPHLASHGYIVASPEFPLTNLAAPGGPNAADVANQPGDWSFVLDAVLAAGLDTGSPLFGAPDEDRIIAAGLSLGGLTTLLATYHGALRDPRVDLAITMAPPGDIFGPGFYTVDTPLLVVFGDSDAILDYDAHGVRIFRRAQSPVSLLTIADGSHTGFSGAGAIVFSGHTDDLGCSALFGGSPPDESDPPPDDSFNLGGEEFGLVPPDAPPACAEEELGESILAIRQHEISRVAVAAYLEAYMGDAPSERAEACDYFETQLSVDVEELSLRQR